MLTKEDMDDTRDELRELHRHFADVEALNAHLGLDHDDLGKTAIEASVGSVHEDPLHDAMALFIAAVHFGMLLERKRADLGS